MSILFGILVSSEDVCFATYVILNCIASIVAENMRYEVTEIKNHDIYGPSYFLWNFIKNRFLTSFEFSGFNLSIGILTILALPSGFSTIESSRG